MKNLIVDRAKWLRGNVGNPLCSRNKKYLCIMGHFFNQVYGVSKDKLRSVYSPGSVNHISVKKNIELLGGVWWNAIEINDNSDLTQRQIEQKLKKLMRTLDVNLKFIGKGNPNTK